MTQTEYTEARALIDVADAQFGELPDGAYWAACTEMGAGPDLQIEVDEYEQENKLGVHSEGGEA